MPHSRPLATMLRLNGKHCVVIGGGSVAARKTAALLAAGARVLVVAPALSEPLRRLVGKKAITWRARPYQAGDLAGAWLVIAASDEPGTNRAVHAEAEERGQFIDVTDQPELSSFWMPAVFHEGGLTVAISTGGASPALAARLRDALHAQWGPEYGRWIRVLARLRRQTSPLLPPATRTRLWRALASSHDLPRRCTSTVAAHHLERRLLARIVLSAAFRHWRQTNPATPWPLQDTSQWTLNFIGSDLDARSGFHALLQDLAVQAKG